MQTTAAPVAPKLLCDTFRMTIGATAASVRGMAEAFKTMPLREQSDPNDAPPDRGEMIANAMLAYRHLEDARMRLGKAIQAYEGREWASRPK